MQCIDLTGMWELRNSDGERAVPAQVPGDTHSALLAAGVIPDPYWGANELEVQWVGRQDWIYSRVFNVDPELLGESSVFLNCDSLDTIAEISINGQLVGRTDNMFRRYRFEVKPVLRPGENEISILFRSAENEAKARSEQLPYVVPHSQYPVQSPHINLVRKVACHGGWDWGCCLMVAGIAGDIYLAGTSLGRIEHVYTTQDHSPGRCIVDVTVEVDSSAGGETELEISLGEHRVQQQVELQPGLQTICVPITVANPKLWWPNGHGAQPLYDLVVRVAGDEVRKRLGLRKLEIVTADDDIGMSFKVRVNDVDIFCKGANWIPADAMPQQVTREYLDHLLTSAAQANMNMIRVWGGGQYESADFYDLCDEKGIMIWQDFMFSCALYPASKEFLANVREEVVYQVKRLRDHACIALWCGNNECLGALNWFEPSRKNRDRYLVDYDRLFEGTIGEAVEATDPTRTYWPSSPSAGRDDYSDNWLNDRRGDMHYWRVWHERAPFSAYYQVRPRFCSEFGYQSFPSLDTIARYAPSEHFNVTAPIMEHHQRHPQGNTIITEMMTRYFRIPTGFANLVYLSQVQQSIAIKTAVEYWRHLQPKCMGTLYWQLNDVWPVCSWSSIEHGGKWKLLHYMARRFYQPVIVTAFQQVQDEVEVWVVSDRHESLSAHVRLRILDLVGESIKEMDFEVNVPGGGSVQVARFALPELVERPEQAFMVLEVEAGRDRHVNEYFFVPYKRYELPVPQITTQVRSHGEQFAVTLTTDKPAFFVNLNVAGIAGEFDDNCITLLPGSERTLLFSPRQKVTQEQLSSNLQVQHLRGTY